MIITGRDPARLKAAAAHLGPGARTVRADAASLVEIERLFAQLAEDKVRLDILFVNAGIGRASPLGQTSEQTFDELFSVNVKGVFFTVQSALPLLNPGASVILNASAGASNGSRATSLYAATKAAVRSLGRSLAADLLDRGVRVNVLSPGPIATPIWERTGAPADLIAATHRRLQISIPAGRMGTPAEVARAAVFLASEDSGFMLGAEVIIDGGATQLPGGAPAYHQS